jgi:Ca2+/Na+ antiporter
LEHPALLLASGGMLFVEFFADKIPGLDSVWDAVHSVIRIPAGAALVAGALGADSATMTTLAALMGGTLAASSQVAKTTTRAAINTSPEPFSNITASLLEDGIAVGAIWLSVQYPFMFGISLTVAIAVLAFITITLFRFLHTALQRVSGFFSQSAKGV